MRASFTVVSTLFAALMVSTACSGQPATEPDAAVGEAAPHSHGPDDAMVSMLVGDGTRRSEVGYRLTHVHLPRQAERLGEVRFTIQRYDGSTVRDFLPMQTKNLHLYVVREDLMQFRHLHPRMDSDGVWVAPLTLPVGGRYRVVAEFAAKDEGGNGDLLMLGANAPVVGEAEEKTGSGVRAAEVAHAVEIEVEGPLATGPDGLLTLVVRDETGRAVKLGSYLGAGAHVTGFHVDSGAVAHLHPLGPPQVTDDGTRLSFHTEFEQAGTYRSFVQVRVGGLLETVPVTLEVG